MHQGFGDTPRREASVTIGDGETESGVLDTLHYRIGTLHFDSEFDGTTLTFKASQEPDGTFQDVYDDSGSQVSLTVAADRAVALASEGAAMALAGFRYLKLVAGAQTNATNIGVDLLY